MGVNEEYSADKVSRVIGVVTDCRFTGDLLCAYVETECHYPCTVVVDPAQLANAGMVPQPERIALIDCHRKERDDILELVKTVAASGAKPVLFDVQGGNGVVLESIRLGVRGFIYTHDPAAVLKKAFQAIFDGELWIERRKVADLLMHESQQEQHHRDHAELTTRECDILALLRDGARNDDIAHHLNISPHTVKTHLYHIFRKIEAPNRLQAAMWASRHLAEVLRKPAEHY
jgi:DNA-binding NarL/FixJ family response regulator